MAEKYALATTRTKDFWRGKMESETFFSAEEALSVGLISGIHGANASAVKKSPRPRMAFLQASMMRMELERKRAGI